MAPTPYSGKLNIVKQANGKFVVVDESGAVLHTKSATIGGKKSPAAPMEFKSKTQAAERLAEMRQDVRNMRFQTVEFTPGANAKGELPVTFDPKDTQGKKVKFLADEAYDKGYRVVERPDAPAAERYGFRNPDGVESNKGFSTPRQAQDAMVKNRGTTPKYGKPPTFEGADYTPPKPEPAAKPEPVKVEPEPVKSTGTAKPPPEVAPVIDGPSRGIGAEAVVNGRNVELRLDGKVVSKDAFNPNDKYYVTDGKRWVRASTLESARAVAGGSEKFKIIDVHQTNQAGAWSRLGAEAAEPALGHPLYEKGKPAPVVEPAPKPTPVTPESVVEDAVNKGKAARGEATIPVTEGTAMPKNPTPKNPTYQVIDRGPEFDRKFKYAVVDNAGNELFTGTKKAATATAERYTSPATAMGTAIKPQALPEGALPKIRAEVAARQQLVAQAQAEAKAAGRIPFQTAPNVPPMTGPAPAPVLPAGASSPVSYSAPGPFTPNIGGIQRIGDMTPVMRAPQPAPLVPQQMIPFQTTPFSGAPAVGAPSAASAAVDDAIKAAMPGTGKGYLPSAGNFPSSPVGGKPTGLGGLLNSARGLISTESTPWLTRAGYASGARGATLGALGRATGRGFGSMMLGNFAGEMVDQSGLLGGKDSAANDAVAAALKGAGYGAAAGAFLPVATPITALIGAGLGAGYSLLNRGDQQQVQSEVPFSSWLNETGAKFGVDPEILSGIQNDYDIRMELAETDAEKKMARETARTEFQQAALNRDTGMSDNMGEALAMQAQIGRYIKPYADMYAGLQNEVAASYDQAARNMSGDFANIAKLGAAQSRAQGAAVGGALMGAAMVDPMIATQQKQAGQMAQIEQQLYAQQMAGMLGTGGSGSSNLLGGG